MQTVEWNMVADTRVFPDRIRNRKVSVLGLARSGIAVCEMLVAGGAQVLASDIRDDEETRAAAIGLRAIGVSVELGSHSEDALLRADFMIPSPGLSPSIPILVHARECGIPIFSEIEVAFWLFQGDVLALTGTNGKTTTATLLHRMLNQGGLDARLAGNVGLAFSAVATRGSAPMVLEVSSFQLEFVETFRPAVSCLLNVAPDHLDRHGSIDDYAEIKYRIALNQGDGDTVVLNADDSRVRRLPVPSGARALFYSIRQFLPEGVFCEDGRLVYRVDGREGDFIRLEELKIPGWHNRANAAAASAMALAYGVDPEKIGAALREFEGVAHRIEPLGTYSGIRVYNDSKATNVGATRVALEAVPGPIVLLVGGRHKDDDPHMLDTLIQEHVRVVVTFGESADRFAAAWKNRTSLYVKPDLKEAVKQAFELANAGDAILLSPACASFDQFNDFEDRGDSFKRYVKETTS